MADPTAASKLNTGCDVPATAPTVTAEYPKIDEIPPAPTLHDTDVDDDHADVMHSAISSVVLAVCSPTPKLSPLTVTDP